MKILLPILLFLVCSTTIFAQVPLQDSTSVIGRNAPVAIFAPSEITVMPKFNDSTNFNGWRSFLQRTINSDVMGEIDSVSLAKYGYRQNAIVQFVVCKDGSLCEFKIANPESVDPIIAREALRVMMKSPKWIPGTVDGKKANILFKQPIVFQLE
jgi:periplasmic protein TonB